VLEETVGVAGAADEAMLVVAVAGSAGSRFRRSWIVSWGMS